MANITTSQLTNLLEKVIDPTLRKLHIPSNKSPLARAWREGRNAGEGTKTMDGTTFYISNQYGSHGNMQTQAEGATLLRGKSTDSQASFTTKTLPGSFTFTLKAKKASATRAGALVDTVMNETEALLDRAKMLQGFYANNDGTGVVALVNDASPNSKSTIAVDTVRGTSIELLLEPDDTIALGSSGDRTGGAGVGVTVASIDSTTQITVDETIAGAANNDLIYFAEAYDNAGSAETSKMGADGLLTNSGTVQGIALATALYYQAQIEATGETISETRVLEYLQLTDPRVKDASAFMTTMGDLWWKFVDQLAGTQQIQNADDIKNRLLQGGANGLRMAWFGGSTPVFHDPYCRTGYVYGVDLKNLGYRQLWPLSLVDDASAMAHRISQKLEFEVAASEDGNFYVIDPRAHFKMTGKTTS